MTGRTRLAGVAVGLTLLVGIVGGLRCAALLVRAPNTDGMSEFIPREVTAISAGLIASAVLIGGAVVGACVLVSSRRD